MRCLGFGLALALAATAAATVQQPSIATINNVVVIDGLDVHVKIANTSDPSAPREAFSLRAVFDSIAALQQDVAALKQTVASNADKAKKDVDAARAEAAQTAKTNAAADTDAIKATSTAIANNVAAIKKAEGSIAKKQDAASLKADVDKARGFHRTVFKYQGHDGKANEAKFLGVAGKGAIIDVRITDSGCLSNSGAHFQMAGANPDTVAGLTLLFKGGECKGIPSKQISTGNQSPSACAAKCASTNGCQYFRYGTAKQFAGVCWSVPATVQNCKAWTTSGIAGTLDTYKLQPSVSVWTLGNAAHTASANLENQIGFSYKWISLTQYAVSLHMYDWGKASASCKEHVASISIQSYGETSSVPTFAVPKTAPKRDASWRTAEQTSVAKSLRSLEGELSAQAKGISQTNTKLTTGLNAATMSKFDLGSGLRSQMGAVHIPLIRRHQTFKTFLRVTFAGPHDSSFIEGHYAGGDWGCHSSVAGKFHGMMATGYSAPGKNTYGWRNTWNYDQWSHNWSPNTQLGLDQTYYGAMIRRDYDIIELRTKYVNSRTVDLQIRINGHGGIVCNSQAPHNLVRYTITGKHTKVQEIKITS